MDTDKNLGILSINSTHYTTRLSPKFLKKKPFIPADPKKILCFIPGTILDILVKEGQRVKKGDDLMILDAMKMQNRLKSSTDGKITRIAVQKGDKVSKGFVLMELK